MAAWLVGMDVSRDLHHGAFTDATATQHWGRLTVPNDAGGALQLAQAIADQAAAHGCDTVRIGCEATGVYAWHLALWLSQPTDPPRPWTVPCSNRARCTATSPRSRVSGPRQTVRTPGASPRC